MYLQKRPHKFNAKSSIYNGYNYASKKEANYAAELDLRLRAKDIESWERQIPVDIYVNGYKICTSRVDFLIHHKDGSKELVEVKGYETPDYRLKKKLIEAVYLVEHPEYSYTVVK